MRERNVIANEPLLPMKQDVQRSGLDPYPTKDIVTGEPIFANEAKDGKPWRKACEECAFRDHWQRGGYIALTEKSDTHFYCVHRKDKREHRVCAGFAAYQKAKQKREERDNA